LKPWLIGFFLLTGCSSTGLLELDRDNLDWGVVDFHNDSCMDCSCADGCDPTQIFLTNTGEAPLNVWMPQGFDDDYLCIDGYSAGPQLSLGELQPEEFFMLRISVCGYEPGDLNTPDENPARPVTGRLLFSTDGEPATAEIPYSFVPTRIQ